MFLFGVLRLFSLWAVASPDYIYGFGCLDGDKSSNIYLNFPIFAPQHCYFLDYFFSSQYLAH